MPTEALGRSQMLAGIPAGLGSLQNLLSVAVDPNVTKESLVEAFELDPALLLAGLTLSADAARDLPNWHTHLETPMLQAAALTLAGRANTGLLANGEGLWPRSIRQALLAEELAKVVGEVDPGTCRLTGLFGGLSATVPTIADDLARVGCAPLVCDAVRYQGAHAEEINGSALLLRIISTARRLLPMMGSPDPLSDEMTDWCRSMFDLGAETIGDAIGVASWRYEQTMRGVRKTDTARSLADAHAGAVFYRALIKAGPEIAFEAAITQSARHLFGCEGVCHISLDPAVQALHLTIDDAPVSIAVHDPRSAIASAYRQQSLVSGAAASATLIEQQLLARLGGEAFFCVPLRGDAGVLFMSANLENVNRAASPQHRLIEAFADAASDLFERTDSDGNVDLTTLRQRTREITHEINNPLAIVQNYLQTMSLKLQQQLGDDHGVQKEIDAIAGELMRVSNLLQKYAQIGDADSLIYSNVDINRLVQELCGLVATDSNRISIDTELDASIPRLELAGDALRQVLLNLLKNAAEALIETPEPRIVVTTQGAVNLGGRHYLEVVIADNGPGMSVNERLELFNGEMSSKGEGRGLGLGIVKSLLDEMGALISCREARIAGGNGSESGGASFQILVPFEPEQI